MILFLLRITSVAGKGLHKQHKRIKNQTRLTCKVKFDGNSIDLMKAEDDNNESMLTL